MPIQRRQRPRPALPGDLIPRKLIGGTPVGAESDPIQHLVENSDLFINTFTLEQGLSSNQYVVTTTPQRIITGIYPRGYIILNPTNAVGLTNSGTLLASAAYAALATGNTQLAPLGVASYQTLAIYLNITVSGGGSVTIDTQTQNPVTLGWATAQSDIFSAPTATGEYYANLGALGIDKSLAIAYTIGGGGGVSFSLSYVLKGGLSGSGSGLANTIFLGGQNVNSVAGYPLLEGRSERWFFRSNAELWAVSLVTGGVMLSVFSLQ